MQGALATPDAQLQNALSRAMFPDTAYGFVSGGDPASIPALTYEKYVRVYRRHYSADNCCITLYGKMDMAEKLSIPLTSIILSPYAQERQPPPARRVQDEQVRLISGISRTKPRSRSRTSSCALACTPVRSVTGSRQLGVESCWTPCLGTNQSPLKARTLEEKQARDIECGLR